MTEQIKRLVKADHVSYRLGIPLPRTYQLTRDGEFDDFVVRIGEKQYRYRLDGLLEYIARGGRRIREIAISEQSAST